MSLSELLPLVRALPADERRQLVHLLVDELDGPAPLAHELPAEFRDFLRPGAVIHTGYQVTTDAAGMQLLHDLMTGSKRAE